jgi:hypothetical protein
MGALYFQGIHVYCYAAYILLNYPYFFVKIIQAPFHLAIHISS